MEKKENLNMKGKKIIVTGGAGFIGSHLTEELVKLGANVLVIDNEFNGRESNLDEAKRIAKNSKIASLSLRSSIILIFKPLFKNASSLSRWDNIS